MALAAMGAEAMNGRAMRVLLVEDNPGDARLIRETLGEVMDGKVQVECAACLADALTRLETGLVDDIILLDLSLPDSRGLETFRSMHAKVPHAAVIVLTGTDDQALAMKAIEEGAQDYLVKGQMDGPLLVRAMRYAIRRQRIEEELRLAKEAAESANRAKSQFLANMSHEIRTPLNAVVGMLDLAMGTELTEEQREYLLIIETATISLLGMINEVLDFAKIEAGKLALDPLEMDLRASVVGVLDLLAPRAHSKGLELAWRADPEVPEFVQCDPGRFRQILFNLVANAIKFTENGEVVVEIDARRGSGEKPGVSVAVRDTGIGIPVDKIDDIFLPFVQVDGSTTRKYGGTGLGLSVTGRLVDLMGGRLEVFSEPNRGSTFRVHFPLDPVPAPRALAPI
jgi:two-component system, sensor histidine kinase